MQLSYNPDRLSDCIPPASFYSFDHCVSPGILSAATVDAIENAASGFRTLFNEGWGDGQTDICRRSGQTALTVSHDALFQRIEQDLAQYSGHRDAQDIRHTHPTPRWLHLPHGEVASLRQLGSGASILHPFVGASLAVATTCISADATWGSLPAPISGSTAKRVIRQHLLSVEPETIPGSHRLVIPLRALRSEIPGQLAAASFPILNILILASLWTSGYTSQKGLFPIYLRTRYMLCDERLTESPPIPHDQARMDVTLDREGYPAIRIPQHQYRWLQEATRPDPGF